MPELSLEQEFDEAQQKLVSELKLFTPKTGRNLMTRQLIETKWFIDDFLKAGLILLVGDPKFGKTWLALNMALSIASGGYFFDKRVAKGSVLYLALEQTENDLHERLHNISMANGNPDIPDTFQYVTVDDFDDSFTGPGDMGPLEQWVKNTESPVMIVVDTLAAFKGPSKGKGNSYEMDYETMRPFRQFALKNNIAFLAVHHTNKSHDGMRAVSGSQAMVGNADVLLLGKKNHDIERTATLAVMGNSIKNQRDLAIKFNAETLQWDLIGRAEEVSLADAEKKIMEALKTAKEPLTPRQVYLIIQEMGWDTDYNKVRKNMARMRNKGILVSTPTGQKNGFKFSIPLDMD